MLDLWGGIKLAKLPKTTVGVDLVCVERIRKLIARYGDQVCAKLFTDLEIEYCARRVQAAESYAARFAVKEATFKALEANPPVLRWREIEVVSDQVGRPTLKLHGKLGEFGKSAGLENLSVSISHDAGYAVAVVAATFHETGRQRASRALAGTAV